MDIAFGGMFYAIVHTANVNELPNLLPENGKDIGKLGAQILVIKKDPNSYSLHCKFLLYPLKHLLVK